MPKVLKVGEAPATTATATVARGGKGGAKGRVNTKYDGSRHATQRHAKLSRSPAEDGSEFRVFDQLVDHRRRCCVRVLEVLAAKERLTKKGEWMC